MGAVAAGTSILTMASTCALACILAMTCAPCSGKHPALASALPAIALDTYYARRRNRNRGGDEDDELPKRSGATAAGMASSSLATKRNVPGSTRRRNAAKAIALSARCEGA